jgi:hypothetical protein
VEGHHGHCYSEALAIGIADLSLRIRSLSRWWRLFYCNVLSFLSLRQSSVTTSESRNLLQSSTLTLQAEKVEHCSHSLTLPYTTSHFLTLPHNALCPVAAHSKPSQVNSPLQHPLRAGRDCVRLGRLLEHVSHTFAHGSLTLNQPQLNIAAGSLGVEGPAGSNSNSTHTRCWRQDNVTPCGSPVPSLLVV